MQIALTLLLAAAPVFQEAPPTPPAPEAPRPVTRISVLGASLSGGYGNSLELVTPKDVRLGRFLACALPQDGFEVIDHGDVWLFTQPISRGREQVDAALAEEPDFVVALDFLFWYGYGDGYVSDDDRVRDLELGLAQLDRFSCPIILGDLPDVTVALQGKGPLGTPVVTRGMIPREVALNRLNARIAYWMAERPRVSQVPLASMLTRMQAGLELTMRGNTWKPDSLAEVLQPDLLHPTARGTLWVTLATLDVMARAHTSIAALPLVWDEATLRERLMAATAAERAREQKKRDAREARRKKAEARERERNEGTPTPVGTGGG
ncbi:MAG: SGNH/GDSL hydrolase family protein [Planctomycetota bacterium]